MLKLTSKFGAFHRFFPYVIVLVCVMVCVMARQHEKQDSIKNSARKTVTKNKIMTFKCKKKTVIEKVLLTVNKSHGK